MKVSASLAQPFLSLYVSKHRIRPPLGTHTGAFGSDNISSYLQLAQDNESFPACLADMVPNFEVNSPLVVVHIRSGACSIVAEVALHILDLEVDPLHMLATLPFAGGHVVADAALELLHLVVPGLYMVLQRSFD